MDYDVPGQLTTENWWQCQRCHREFSDSQLKEAIGSQEKMHEQQEMLDTQGMGGDPYSSADANRPGNRNALNGVLADAKTRGIIAHPSGPIPNLVSTQEDYDLASKPPKYRKSLKKKVESIESVSLEVWAGFEFAPLRAFIAQFLAGHKFEDVSASARKKKGLRNVFIEAFENGMNLPQLAAEIESLGFENADSIARTESIRISNEAKLLHAESNEHKKVIFTATTDDRTCEICEGLNGKEYSISKAKGVIPGQTHTGCRCTWQVIP